MDTWFVELDEAKDFLTILLWGKEGSTKTTHATTASQFGKVLVIASEAGTKKQALQQHGVVTANVKKWPKPGQTITIQGLRDLRDRIQADLMKDPGAWFAVVMDSATVLADILVAQAQAKRVEKEKRKGMEPDPDFTDRADYGIMTKQMRELIRSFQDLPCHLVITALERRDEDESTKKVTYGPAVTPALQLDLLGYVDLALYLRAPDEDGPARALVRGKSTYRTKDRYDALPNLMAEPTFERIQAYVNGELNPDTDPVQKTLKSKPSKPNNAAPAA